MANKSLWIVVGLVAAGVLVFVLSIKQENRPQKVQMQEVFNQKPVEITVNTASATPAVVEKDPVPSPAIITSPVQGKEAGFAVQVYSFKDEKRADTALANLKTQGYKAYIEISDLGEKGTWYRVRIGNLANEAEAKAMLETIRKNFNSGIIVKPNA